MVDHTFEVVPLWQKRRAQLCSLLPGAAVLLANGKLRYRNLEAFPYPFRGSSHFLHFCGKQEVGAYLLMTGNDTSLFLEDAPPDDLLWHGPRPSREEIRQSTGVDQVRSVTELPSILKQLDRKSLYVLPTADPTSNRELADLIGRAPEPRGIDSPLVEAIVACRLVNDDLARREFRAAAAVTVKAFHAGMTATKPGRRESEVVAALEREFSAAGCESAYQSICSVHGEVLHNHSYENMIAADEMLLVDAGAESRGGYASDVTRTWPVSGRFSRTQRDLYAVVLAAQKKAAALVRPGTRYREIHLAACRVLAEGLVSLGLLEGEVDSLVERGAHALFFPHGVGHLMGLDVQDMRDLGDAAWYGPGRERSAQFGLNNLRLDRDLAAGMCVTIEPGIYFVPSILEDNKLTDPFADCLRLERVANFSDVRGIRIEDNFLVTEKGAEVLTAEIPKEIAALEGRVGKG